MKNTRKNIVKFLLKDHRQGDQVETSALYECSECEGLQAFKKGENFHACKDCNTNNPEQTWHGTEDLIDFVSKNLNTEFDRVETLSFKAAEIIADFAGNIHFVYFHVIWFGLWIFLNTGTGHFNIPMFDPYPFPFLVLVVSLEAIFLATFILIAQNMQSERSEIRADIDYRINLKTEKDVAEMLAILSDVREGKLVVSKNGKIEFRE